MHAWQTPFEQICPAAHSLLLLQAHCALPALEQPDALHTPLIHAWPAAQSLLAMQAALVPG